MFKQDIQSVLIATRTTISIDIEDKTMQSTYMYT